MFAQAVNHCDREYAIAAEVKEIIENADVAYFKHILPDTYQRVCDRGGHGKSFDILAHIIA
jgi:hypothetical protein